MLSGVVVRPFYYYCYVLNFLLTAPIPIIMLGILFVLAILVVNSGLVGEQ
ncbi:hypothetical protein GQ55_2G273900 [Panicum hallii var. hallii]|uniref:Uncharacterized protein n=1 Tax=Panicum hallii var. hallii TaxID=1504633 RepID=A0A2T7ESW1_9POAL|nr:hypothetical protein GQ55_2G273900 [Panicum hallii var. hallii]